MCCRKGVSHLHNVAGKSRATVGQLHLVATSGRASNSLLAKIKEMDLLRYVLGWVPEAASVTTLRQRIPGPAPMDRNTSGWVLSASARAGGSLGPVGVNLELGAARNYNNSQSGIFSDLGRSWENAIKGIHGAASVGGQLTRYTPRTKYLPLQKTCHL